MRSKKKQLKPKRWVYRSSTYPTEYLINCGGTYEQARKWSMKQGYEFEDNSDYISEETSGYFQVASDSPIGIMLWFKDGKPSGSTVAHESFHGVMQTLNAVGVFDFSVGQQEVVAYPLSELVKEIGNKVWK